MPEKAEKDPWAGEFGTITTPSDDARNKVWTPHPEIPYRVACNNCGFPCDKRRDLVCPLCLEPYKH